MTKFLFIISFLTISNSVKCQITALTQNGQEVLLFENGTWKYSQDSIKQSLNISDSIVTNAREFSKSIGASFLVKSNTFNIGVFINPAKWTFSFHKENEKNPEYRFSLKSGEGYVMMLTEQTSINLEDLRQIALSNARSAALDAKITRSEYRKVNDKKVLCLKIEGTIHGIKFIYFGYYFSNENGTVQLVSFTSKQFFDSVEKDFEVFLNGFVELAK